MTIRWLIRKDMPEVLHIEQQCFEFPWSEEEFLKTLKQRNCIGMVAENKSQAILGYVIYTMHEGYLNIENLAVHPEYQRIGVGSEIINKLIKKLERTTRTKIKMIVRETNLSALQFLKHHQFMAVDIVKNYYENSTEDAYLMAFTTKKESYNPSSRLLFV